MKKLLSWGGVSLLTGALLDPLIYGGLGGAIPWGRDFFMAAAGAGCIYLLIQFRDEL